MLFGMARGAHVVAGGFVGRSRRRAGAALASIRPGGGSSAGTGWHRCAPEGGSVV